MTNSVNYRSRKHLILLYPDTSDFLPVSKNIIENYDYIMITHDKDLDETDEVKKAHVHIILLTPNAVWNTALSLQLGIDTRFIQKVRNDEQSLMYLLHYNQPKKYQYDISECTGTKKIIDRLVNILKSDDMSESEISLELLTYINKCAYISYSDFACYCATENKWSVLRRSSYYFIKLLDEHNEAIRDKYYNSKK